MGYRFPIKNISVTATNKGGFFVFGQRGEQTILLHKNTNNKQFKEIKLSNNAKIFKNLTNSFWSDGLLYFEFNGRIITYDTKNIFERSPRRSIFDKQGNLWIGTNDGVFILSVKEKRFKQYFVDKGKNNQVYDGRGIWANEEMMFSVSPSNCYRYQFKENHRQLMWSELAKNKFISIIQSKDNSFWIGAKSGLLFNVNIDNNTMNKTVKGFTNQLWSLFEDKNKRIWVGQGKNGLYYFDSDKMEEAQKYNQLNGFDEIEQGRINHITQDRRNNNHLWFACQSGWYLLDIKDGIKHRYWSKTVPNFAIKGDEIQFTHQDNDGVFWLATTYSGLVKVELSPNYEVISSEQFTISEGLSSNTIYAVYEDKNGMIWISTNNGINSFNKKTKEVQVFLEEDGLPHYEFNRLSNFQRADGTIFFGTLNGIVSFQPDDLKDKVAYNVPLAISRCEKYSEKIKKIMNITAEVLTKNKIIIRPNEQLATLYISLQNYSTSLQTKYFYRINGLQDEFIQANKNEINLNGLPYGKYTLEVKAKAPDGRFSTQMINIPLIVKRPFYLEWWFILLALISLALAVWQLFQARTRVLQSRKKELEEIVKDRTAQLQQQATQLQLDKNTIEVQAKELQSLDKMKSRFFANISHELRTPLTLILSPVQSILKRQKADNRDFTSAKIIEQNAQKLLKRINEILDLTKLEAKEMQLKPQPTPFYDFIKRLTANFEGFATEKEQQLTFKYQLDKNLNLQLDQDKYEHIFNNYLSNAIKFTPKGGKINIQLFEKQGNNHNGKLENLIVLSVKDNGQGIPKSDLEKVFDRFFQSDNDQNKTGSSGIGLALSKEIAHLMEGNVFVESELGNGSVFYFEMPYVEELGVLKSDFRFPISENKSSIVLHHTNSNIGNQTLEIENKPTILLVEDNTQLRNYIQLILQEKYNVITAENGKAALEQLEKPSTVSRQPSAVISDIMMPKMNGFELLENLKSSDKWKHIPVIMLTAKTNTKDKLKALRIGVDDYILKPFEEDELMARIENLITNAKNRVETVENTTVEKVKQKQPQKSTSPYDLKWLEKVEKRLQAEVSNSKFNIDSLADAMNLSRSHLHRRIKTITGLTPNKYFREIKLQAAREILENGDAQTVSEVCYAVGFDTPKYFSKVYEQRFGKRPISYLR